MAKKRRLILTNVNASVFRRKYCATFLSELIVNALLHEEVLIRVGDLIGNRNLLNYLRHDVFSLRVFAELLSTGAVKILRESWRSYPPNVRRNPKQSPISARAEDLSLNRSYKGKAWEPTHWEWDLFEYLDGVVTGSRESHQCQTPFPTENMFAAELSELLTRRESYNLHRRRIFRDIVDRGREMPEKFIEFCTVPHAWERFLRDHGMHDPPGGRGGGFYRTQAYQCATFFPPEAKRAMERLIESTYAACECDREHAEGRYGRSALAELPAKCDNYDEAYNEVKSFDVVPVMPAEKKSKNKSGLTLAVVPGIGDVLAEVRASNPFKELQEELRKLGREHGPEGEYRDPHKILTERWNAVCSQYGDSWAKHVKRRGKADQVAGRVALWTYLGARTLGFTALCFDPERLKLLELPVDIMALADYQIVYRIEHWFPAFSERVRTLFRMPAAREEMVNAITGRVSKVVLRLDPGHGES